MNDGHEWLRQPPASVNVHNWPPRGEHHDPLHHSREEEEGKGDADHWVNDAEGLPAIGQRGCVTVSCWEKKKTTDIFGLPKDAWENSE